MKISFQVILKTSIAGLAVSYEVCDAKALTELQEYLRLDIALQVQYYREYLRFDIVDIVARVRLASKQRFLSKGRVSQFRWEMCVRDM